MPPDDLAKGGYSADSVRAKILSDQDGKCYICEREMRTDFQVEHRKSRTHYPELANDWGNLLLSCGYCNGKKLDAFDDIVDPVAVNVEEYIYQYYDPERENFTFTPKVNITPEVERTCELLNRIFNGTRPQMLTTRENAFRREFLAFYNRFIGKINEYLINSSAENEASVRDELTVLRTYLGFKYWIVMDCAPLKNKFAADTQWNRASNSQPQPLN